MLSAGGSNGELKNVFVNLYTRTGDQGSNAIPPTSVQKIYFMLTCLARAVLDTSLRIYCRGKTEPILVGGIARLKPAQQRLMMSYRLTIQEVSDDEVVTSYTR